MKESRTYNDQLNELEELRIQLQEANDTIDAIRNGQIDALFVENEKGTQLYTLKTADQTYRVFIEKMKEGAVTLNKSEIILYSNSQFATMVGYPLTKIIGIPFKEFVPDICQTFFEEIVKKGWESDSKGELLLLNKNGDLIPFLLSITSLELDEGKALSIILTDLSFQKATEQELKLKNEQLEEVRHKIWAMNEKLEETVVDRTKELFLSREHFKFLAENIPVIVWTTNSKGEPNYFNKRWYEYTGLSLEESVGTGSQQALHQEDINNTLQNWHAALDKKVDFEFEYRIKNAEGEYRWHLGKAHPLKDELGNIINWFGTSTDIEDQRKELEKKDEFISVASHELKTPLTSVKGYIQLMELREDLPDDITRYIKKTNQSINKLQNLINDLLDVSKIQAGKLKFDIAVLNLTDLLEIWIENCKHIYTGYQFSSEIDNNLVVTGNAERLEQVLMNQISNAVKYSQANKEIIIKTEKKNGKVKVSVVDFGIGLSVDDQDKIFDRFYRAEKSKVMASGLGMGLYISSEIIKEHQGEMGVTCEPGKGTSVFFSLPLINEKV